MMATAMCLIRGMAIQAVEYTYGALGRRIEKKDRVTSANTRRYFYSKDWQVLDEYSGDAAPVLKRSYLYGNYIDEVLLAWIGIPPHWRYYVHDHLYSVAAQVNTSSAVTERYEYDACRISCDSADDWKQHLRAMTWYYQTPFNDCDDFVFQVRTDMVKSCP